MLLQIHTSATFNTWFERLRDLHARDRITVRIRRLSLGNPGDVRAVGHGVSEMRINYGPGYRIYYKQHGCELIVLLCGGDKRTQNADIRRAISIARDWEM